MFSRPRWLSRPRAIAIFGRFARVNNLKSISCIYQFSDLPPVDGSPKNQFSKAYRFRILLRTSHYPLLTTHYSLLNTHYSILNTQYSLLTTHYQLPFIASATGITPWQSPSGNRRPFRPGYVPAAPAWPRSRSRPPQSGPQWGTAARCPQTGCSAPSACQ